LQVGVGAVIYAALNILLKTQLWQVGQSLIQQILKKREFRRIGFPRAY
jgi:hypothetical protein